MATIQPILLIEIDPSNPVQEICAVIMAMIPYHTGKEDQLLKGVAAAIYRRLEELEKGEEPDAK